MRYKFRGKRLDGEWVYGYYSKKLRAATREVKEFDVIIQSPIEYVVLPESVGQWTGLVDRHGKEVFEGDVLHRDGHQNMFIEFYKGAFCLVSCDPVQRANWSPVACRGSDIIYREIIGNVFDNGDLYDC